MSGRYGSDELSFVLLMLYLGVCIFAMFTHLRIFQLLGLAIILWAFFRILSRNIPARRAENAAFLRLAGPVIRWCKLRRCARRDRDYCYFTCPHCKQMLRAPKGKGKIHVTCRTCGTVFEKTT